MNYKLRRRLYSQNFLRNPKLIYKLIRLSSIGEEDLVLEIGPGKGSITEKLLEFAGQVVAVELDRKLCLHLNLKFRGIKKLSVVNKDFNKYSLPQKPFKAFSNIPFNITADVIRKLTANSNFTEGYLVIQKEAAKRFVGMPYDIKNSMQAMFLKPFFDIKVIYEFRRWDFVPKPNVDVVLLKIYRKENPKIEEKDKNIYRNFLRISFNRCKFSRLDDSEVFERFGSFMCYSVKYKGKVLTKRLI